jgi:hypothetical protein
MPYVPPALNAVNFALISTTPVAPGARHLSSSALSVYSPPALSAVDFVLSTFTAPANAGVLFELAIALYGILKYYTGAAFEKIPLKAYVSGSWQAKALKRWSGTEWLQVDTTGI